MQIANYLLCISFVIDVLPDIPAVLEVVTVTSYSAPGCRSEMMTWFCVQGTVIVPPNCLFLEPMIMLYVTM